MSLSLNPPRAYALANTYNLTSVSTGMGWSWSGWVRMMATSGNSQGIWSAAAGPGSATIQLQYQWTYVYSLYINSYVFWLRIGAYVDQFPYILPVYSSHWPMDTSQSPWSRLHFHFNPSVHRDGDNVSMRAEGTEISRAISSVYCAAGI